jgi:hypothetical protein
VTSEDNERIFGLTQGKLLLATTLFVAAIIILIFLLHSLAKNYFVNNEKFCLSFNDNSSYQNSEDYYESCKYSHEKNQENINVALMYGRVLIKGKRLDEAVVLFTKYKNTYFFGNQNLIEIYEDRGEHELALAALKDLAKDLQNSPQTDETRQLILQAGLKLANYSYLGLGMPQDHMSARMFYEKIYALEGIAIPDEVSSRYVQMLAAGEGGPVDLKKGIELAKYTDIKDGDDNENFIILEHAINGKCDFTTSRKYAEILSTTAKPYGSGFKNYYRGKLIALKYNCAFGGSNSNWEMLLMFAKSNDDQNYRCVGARGIEYISEMEGLMAQCNFN